MNKPIPSLVMNEEILETYRQTNLKVIFLKIAFYPLSESSFCICVSISHVFVYCLIKVSFRGLQILQPFNIVLKFQCFFYQVTYDNVIAPLVRLEAEEFALIQACKFPMLVSSSKDVQQASKDAENMLDAYKKKCRQSMRSRFINPQRTF